jgi:hypothetical protein
LVFENLSNITKLKTNFGSFEIFPRISNLRHLKLEKGHEDPDSCVTKKISELTDLLSLSTKPSLIPLRELRKLTNLTSLDLLNPSDYFIPSLPLISHLTNLQRLSLTRVQLDPHSILPSSLTSLSYHSSPTMGLLDEDLALLTSLTELSISFSPCTLHDLSSFLTNLHTLSVTHLPEFSAQISSFPSLTHLSLSSVDANYYDIIQATRLSSLSLEQVNLVHQPLHPSLSSLSSLTHLAVYPFPVLPTSAITSLRGLQDLRWKERGIKNEDLEGLKNLTRLYVLGGSAVTEEAAFRLLPRLQDFIKGTFSLNQ